MLRASYAWTPNSNNRITHSVLIYARVRIEVLVESRWKSAVWSCSIFKQENKKSYTLFRNLSSRGTVIYGPSREACAGTWAKAHPVRASFSLNVTDSAVIKNSGIIWKQCKCTIQLAIHVWIRMPSAWKCLWIRVERPRAKSGSSRSTMRRL